MEILLKVFSKGTLKYLYNLLVYYIFSLYFGNVVQIESYYRSGVNLHRCFFSTRTFKCDKKGNLNMFKSMSELHSLVQNLLFISSLGRRTENYYKFFL